MKAKSHSYRKYKLQERKTEYLLLWPPRARAENTEFILVYLWGRSLSLHSMKPLLYHFCPDYQFPAMHFSYPTFKFGGEKKFKKPVSAGVEWLNGSAISREKKQSAFYPSLSGQPFLKVPSSINRENPYFFNVKNKSSCSWEEYLQSVKTWDVLHPGILWKYLDFFVSSEEENLLLHNLF